MKTEIVFMPQIALYAIAAFKTLPALLPGNYATLVIRKLGSRFLFHANHGMQTTQAAHSYLFASGSRFSQTLFQSREIIFESFATPSGSDEPSFSARRNKTGFFLCIAI
jgi:hypothetical protein